MAKYRKLSRTSSQRKALIRGQVTALIANGKIVTTEAKAKEIRKVAEGLIAAAVREKDNFDEVTVTAKVARKDADGKRVKEVVDGKKVTVYDEVEKKIKKDQPSRLHARREMLKVLYPVTEVPAQGAGRKKNTGIKADDPLCGGTPSCTVCILCADAAWVDRSGTGGFHASNLSGWTVYLTPSWEGI